MLGQQVQMPVDLMYGSVASHSTTVLQYVVVLHSNLLAAYEQSELHCQQNLGVRRSCMITGCTESHLNLVI